MNQYKSCYMPGKDPMTVIFERGTVSGIATVEKNNPQINAHIQVRGNEWKHGA